MARKKRGHRLIKGLLVLLVVAVVACGAVLGVSANKIHTHIHEIEESYASYQAYLDEKDYLQAIAELKEVAATAQKLKTETHAWYWNAAQSVPVLGEDVVCAQRLTVVCDKLANEALLPVFEETEDLLGDYGSDNLIALLAQKAGQAVEVLSAMDDAHDVAKTCLAQMNEVPQSHFGRLNELVEEVRAAVTQAVNTLDQIDPLLSLAGAMV